MWCVVSLEGEHMWCVVTVGYSLEGEHMWLRRDVVV